MLAQPRKIRLVARQAEQWSASCSRCSSRPAAAQYDIGKPTKPNCAIGGAAAKLRRLVWFGIRRGPRREHYGGLSFGARSSSPRRRLERRFKLQPQLPGQSMPTAVRYSATIADILVLGAAGQDFPLRCEVRIVGDEKKAIVDALNALWHRCTYERGAPAHDARPQG